MPTTPRPTHWAWRRTGEVQHLAITGRKPNQLATYCNRYWIQDHVRPVWEHADVANRERRPCLLCVGWLTRNGASWQLLASWMESQGQHVRPNRPTARYLEAV